MKNKKNKTKRIVQLTLLVGTIASLFIVPWVLVWAWLSPLPDTVQEELDKAVDRGFSGVIVCVDQKGNAPEVFTAGWHDPTEQIPARADAYFKIASINKLFDAVAVAKLVAEGRLSLDKTLSEYLPELEGKIENADRITLRMLVQHKSGIPNYTDTPDYWAHPKMSYDENLNLIINKPANFEPGEGYEYCNTNYLLINRIMDKVLGYENFEFIKERIISPLGLDHTFASIHEVNSADIMSGFHDGHEADLKSDDLGMISTAQDIAVFIRALNTGSLLTEKEREIYSSIYKFGHAGWVPGYESFAEYHEDEDAVMVCFYSTTDPDLIKWNLAEIINGRVMRIVDRAEKN